MSSTVDDGFATRYSASLLPNAAAAIAATRRKRGQAGAAPIEPWALGGTVLTPEVQIDDGWVVVEGAHVAELSLTKPAGVRALQTGGVILPGLIDLHGHPEWNVFPAWEPPRLYPNRYVWRNSAEFESLVKHPMHAITSDFSDGAFMQLLARYAEIRALVGGTTMVQGASGEYPAAAQAIVRHAELAPFGEANAASLIDPLKAGNADERDVIRDGIEAGTITAFYAHVAEGTDRRSRSELTTLSDENLLTGATVIIHGTALDESDLAIVRDAGAKLVFSAQSNLRLYGKTTQAAVALQLGIPLTIGADWLPSGSVGLLAELQVARRVLTAQGARIGAQELLEMVTVGAAEIAGLKDHVGRIAPGRPADLVVLERAHQDPYEAVCRARRASVELVVIDGHLLYGRDDWFKQLAPKSRLVAKERTGELVWAWGKRMRLDVAAPAEGDEPALPGLAAIRAAVLKRWPRAGPIFA